MRHAALGFALLLSSGAATAHAQQHEYGLKAGPTIATLADESAPSGAYQHRVSGGGGAFVVLASRRAFALQVEALFTPKGARLEIDKGVSDTLMLDYFEVPLVGRLAVAHSSSRSVHVFGGPSAAIRINAKHKLSQSGGGFSSGFTEDVGDTVKRFDLSMTAGAGVNAGRHLVIDARYSWGLHDISRVPAGPSVRTRALTVLAGVRF